jgi:hypothetical protein
VVDGLAASEIDDRGFGRGVGDQGGLAEEPADRPGREDRAAAACGAGTLMSRVLGWSSEQLDVEISRYDSSIDAP